MIRRGSPLPAPPPTVPIPAIRDLEHWPLVAFPEIVLYRLLRAPSARICQLDFEDLKAKHHALKAGGVPQAAEAV